MNYEHLLSQYPAAEYVDEESPEFGLFEADGGCKVCTRGEPCQDRISTDVTDILGEAGLPLTYELACLQWLYDRQASSLTQSITDMATEFRAATTKLGDK